MSESKLLPERRTTPRDGVTVTHALRSTTRASIFEHLQEHDIEAGFTVRDVADRFELHPNVARTHLEILADASLVEVGRRKHAGGGRPAKVYRAKEDAEEVIAADEAPASPAETAPGAALLVRLLADLVEERPAPAFGRVPSLVSRAHEIAVAEGRRLVEELGDHRRTQALEQSDGGSDRLEVAAQLALAALRPHAPGVRIADRNADAVDVAGVRGMFGLLETVRPSVAEALERGILAGAFVGSGMPVSLADGGGMGHGQVLRARPVPVSPPKLVPTPARTVDTRGQHPEAAVVHALRAVAMVGEGDAIEVLAEGPGSPRAFARWADRAGHQLLGVERATDANGQAAIRLLIRKGAT